jgi:hypothetical protein
MSEDLIIIRAYKVPQPAEFLIWISRENMLTPAPKSCIIDVYETCRTSMQQILRHPNNIAAMSKTTFELRQSCNEKYKESEPNITCFLNLINEGNYTFS